MVVNGSSVEDACKIYVENVQRLELRNASIENTLLTFHMGGLSHGELPNLQLDNVDFFGCPDWLGTSGFNYYTIIHFDDAHDTDPNGDAKIEGTTVMNSLNFDGVCDQQSLISVDNNWQHDLEVNGLNFDNGVQSIHVDEIEHAMPAFLFEGNSYNQHFSIRNATLKDANHYILRAGYYGSGSALFDNLTATNLRNLTHYSSGNEWGMYHLSQSSSYRPYSHNYINQDGGGGSGSAGYLGTRGSLFFATYQDFDVAMKSSTITGLMNSLEDWVDHSEHWYNGIETQCIIFDVRGDLEIIDSVIENNCGMTYGANDSTHWHAYSDWSVCMTTGNWESIYPGNPNYCVSWTSVVAILNHNTNLYVENTVIKDNNRLRIHTSSLDTYKKVLSTQSVFFAVSAYSPSYKIVDSELKNNSYQDWTNYIPTATNSKLWRIQAPLIFYFEENTVYEPSIVLEGTTVDTSGQHQENQGNQSAFWGDSGYGVRVGDLIMTGSQYAWSFINDSSVEEGMIELRDGEITKWWTVKVEVTDPDFEKVENATVTLVESNGWSLGEQTTGPDGRVSYMAKEFSWSTTTFFSYNPHNLSVTTNSYTGSQDVTVNNTMLITVIDPTPDDFPGDVTQDFDTDGDGWGDNYTYDVNESSGLRENQSGDAFTDDPTQWSDIDGDGYGDNYTWTMNGTTGLRDQNGDWAPTDPTQWSDADGDGYGDNQTGNEPDYYPEDPNQWNDADGDGHADFYTFDLNQATGLRENQSGDAFPNDSTQWNDTDGDGWGDNYTWTINASSNLRDQNGDAFWLDATQWSDLDGDGYGGNYTCIWSNATMTCTESGDDFPYDATQWSDLDNDGYGDNLSGNNPDPNLFDSDNDGYNNTADEFPWNPTQWEDADGDGLGDNTNGTNADPYPDDTDNDGYNNSADAFPFDSTQWEDADGDGYGDNQSGNYPDPSLNDSDNDYYTNDVDAFPWNPTQWNDTDGDGWGDNPEGFPADDFPDDPTQWTDTDGDGYGDNQNGNNGDDMPNDPSQWSDYDGDGYGDNPNGSTPDGFPTDPSQWSDSDGDGWGDNYTFSVNSSTGLREGQTGDAMPYDPTQWSDTDGDGYGDNQDGNNADWDWDDPSQWVDADGDNVPDNYSYQIDPFSGHRVNQVGDAFPEDGTQWSDYDGDGYGDNQTGNDPDWDWDDPTQWEDADNDGLGDNPLGTNPDPTPGDFDNDGFRDYEDAFPNDPLEAFDTDGDGIGDNGDPDDDNDGWSDLLEVDCMTLMLDANSTPVDPDQDGTCSFLDDDDDDDGVEDQFDDCPDLPGNSTYDLTACPDSDGDTVSDTNDQWPDDPYRTFDSDGDGYDDPLDAFPFEATQWIDNDMDGFGDNPSGANPDPYLDDSDNDGVINQLDAFPFEATQWEDSDSDGYGDNPDGVNPDPYLDDTDNDGTVNEFDLYRLDPSQSSDSDGDGYGDNPSGEFGDKFPSDPTQCCDRDGDGWGDNPNGSNPDAFPDDSTQWADLDGDGLGDNPSGNDPDPYPGDFDNDGVPDGQDAFPKTRLGALTTMAMESHRRTRECC